MKAFTIIALATLAACSSSKPQEEQADVVQISAPHLAKLGGAPLITPSNIITWTMTENSDGGSVPDGGADGISLNGVQAMRLTVKQLKGNAVDAGTVGVWLQEASTGQWSRVPVNDLPVYTAGAKTQAVSWGDVPTLVPSGRFKPVVYGTFSSDGGTQVLVTITYVQQ